MNKKTLKDLGFKVVLDNEYWLQFRKDEYFDVAFCKLSKSFTYMTIEKEHYEIGMELLGAIMIELKKFGWN